MTPPVASVIVPCRNAEKTLEAALAGPLSSPLRELEIVAVDDGSSDGTAAALERIASSDGRVVVIRTTGIGVSAARNLALEAARGEFIFFLDADDTAEPNFYPKAIEAMRRDGADYCRVGHDEVFLPDGKLCSFPLKDGYRFSSTDEIRDRYLPCYFGYSFSQVKAWYAGTPLWERREKGVVWAGCFRAGIIKDCNLRFDETIEIFEDAMFLCEYLLACRRTTSVNEILYHYHLSPYGSVCSKMAGAEFFANKLRLLSKREEIDAKSGGRLTAMYAASCVFSLLEILHAAFKIKGCFTLGFSTFRRYGADPVVRAALRRFPLSWRRPFLAISVAACRMIAPVLFMRREP